MASLMKSSCHHIPKNFIFYKREILYQWHHHWNQTRNVIIKLPDIMQKSAWHHVNCGFILLSLESTRIHDSSPARSGEDTPLLASAVRRGVRLVGNLDIFGEVVGRRVRTVLCPRKGGGREFGQKLYQSPSMAPSHLRCRMSLCEILGAPESYCMAMGLRGSGLASHSPVPLANNATRIAESVLTTSPPPLLQSGKETLSLHNGWHSPWSLSIFRFDWEEKKVDSFYKML